MIELNRLFQDYLEAFGYGTLDNETLSFEANATDIIQEWAWFIVNYTQTDIEDNFMKAWEKFGKVWVPVFVFDPFYATQHNLQAHSS